MRFPVKIFIIVIFLFSLISAGTYYIVRNIEIDPDQVWIDYGQEIIGKVQVLENTEEPNIKISVAKASLDAFASSMSGDAITGLTIVDTTTHISIFVSLLSLGLVGFLSLFILKKKPM